MRFKDMVGREKHDLDLACYTTSSVKKPLQNWVYKIKESEHLLLKKGNICFILDSNPDLDKHTFGHLATSNIAASAFILRRVHAMSRSIAALIIPQR